MELEERQELADTVLAAVGRLPRETALVVASTLAVAPGPFRRLGDVLDGYLHDSETLARLQLAYELRRLSRDPQVYGSLANVTEEPWLALRRALKALRDDELEAMLPT